MSVYKKKWTSQDGRAHTKWMVHIKHKRQDGTHQVIRKVSPINTRRAAEAYERELREQLLPGGRGRGQGHGKEKHISLGGGSTAQAPTLAEFIDTFIREHSEVEGLRPRYMREQRRVLEQHVVPVVGELRLDQIGSRQFSMVKRHMHRKNSDYSPKTINNTLGVMSKLVRFWWEHQELDAPRFKIGLIRMDQKDAQVYEPQIYEQLVSGAAATGNEVLAIILLMGDAGLRQGEVRALQRGDLRFGEHPSVRVQRTRSREGEEHPPKGKRNRTVPMTSRLAAALREHLRSSGGSDLPHVFISRGQPMSQSAVRARVRRAERRAGLQQSGRSHIMRHTFVTDLAENNTAPRVIQELAGHKDLKTTLRYMHLRDGMAQAAIKSLEQRHAQQPRST
ncbi:XerC/D integrase-recombinase protein [Enhygromyxa salina]|uniref:XerC/D integrase-recombinase protein n=1 Tax=Enhygromyxa salina TaxID=215803 RepID=A0A0C1ZTG0_9BACT|nr:site-specific integrase [Enhygromyxa salina]KIG14343.1 XerC/D integrase-recombinase protein [Enhygromyxa salina]